MGAAFDLAHPHVADAEALAHIGLAQPREAQQHHRGIAGGEPGQRLPDGAPPGAFVAQRLIPRRDGRGRVPAVEVMLNSPLISDLIFKGDVSGIKEIMKKSRELGMQTFDQSLFDLYEGGLISYEDALRNADSVNDLRLQIKLNSQRARAIDLPLCNRARSACISAAV